MEFAQMKLNLSYVLNCLGQWFAISILRHIVSPTFGESQCPTGTSILLLSKILKLNYSIPSSASYFTNFAFNSVILALASSSSSFNSFTSTSTSVIPPKCRRIYLWYDLRNILFPLKIHIYQYFLYYKPIEHMF